MTWLLQCAVPYSQTRPELPAHSIKVYVTTCHKPGMHSSKQPTRRCPCLLDGIRDWHLLHVHGLDTHSDLHPKTPSWHALTPPTYAWNDPAVVHPSWWPGAFGGCLRHASKAVAVHASLPGSLRSMRLGRGPGQSAALQYIQCTPQSR